MSSQEEVTGSIAEKIIKVMELPACRMISSVIMSGYVCSGEKKITSPGNNLVLEILQTPPAGLNQQISKAIQANLFIWTLEPEIRDELFDGENSFEQLMPIIADGGMQWFSMVKDKLITEQDFCSLFRYLKKVFIACAGENGRSHEKYTEIIKALEDVIAPFTGKVSVEAENAMEKLGELLGAVASYAIVNIYGGETLIPLMATYQEDGVIKFSRITGPDFDNERMFEKGYTGDLNSAIEHGLNLLQQNPDNSSYNALVLERRVETSSGAFDNLYCIGVIYGEAPAQVDVLLPYQKKMDEKEFELYMPNPFHLEPEDLDVDTVMNGFLSGLKHDTKGWEILQSHFNNEPHPVMQKYS